MARPLRVSWVGGVFHVMNRGVARQPIFYGDADRVEFGQRLAAIHDRFGVETLAYCLMTNHFHLVARVTRATLSEAMQHLASVFTRHTNDRVGRDGPLFRGRFASVAITTDPQLLRAVRYVHRNALDLPGVDAIDTYRWSSMRAYLGLRRVPPFMNLEIVLGAYGDRRSFLDAHLDESLDGVAIRSVDELDAVIDHAISAESLRCDVRTDQASVSRATVRALVVVRRGTSVSALADDVFPSANARYSAVSRARARARVDPRIDRIVANVLASIAA